mmetsp:Transcript_17647/g.41500  ORF Transcript_17647/g.41500 Transcript_17647/m.41500 type:complete len:360 (-) Transcript_17647:357-1436(-)
MSKQYKANRKPRGGKKTFTCPLLSIEEREAVRVAMADIDHPTKGILATVNNHGYFIVPDLFSKADILQAQEAMQHDILELVDDSKILSGSAMERAWKRFLQHGPAALPKRTAEVIGNIGRFQKCGFPQGRFAWFCRTHPNVKRVYEVLHGTTELVSSMDNSFFANGNASEEITNRYSPHVDLNENISDEFRSWEVYQGLVYVWSSEASKSSTTVVWPRSHKPEIFSAYTNDPKSKRSASRGLHFSHLAALTPGPVKEAMDRGFRENARRATVPAGGGLFWSSRTTHQGWSGGPRLAQPVCWEPICRRTGEAFHRKLFFGRVGFAVHALGELGSASQFGTSQDSQGDCWPGGFFKWQQRR